MADKIKLTAKRVADFRCPAGKSQAFLYDSEVPGLAVRATPGSDVRSFVFRYRLRDQTPRLTIGDVRAWDIESSDPKRPGAREEARRLQTLVDQGIDPREAKSERDAEDSARRAEARRREAPASEAWAAYVADRTPRWSARHLADHVRMVKPGGAARTRGRRATDPAATMPGAIRPLLTVPLAEIDADRMREWLRAETARRPTQASLAFRLVRAFLRWCGRQSTYRGQVHADAYAASLAKDVLPKRQAKQDCLQRGQLQAWFAAVRAIPNPTIAAYLQVLLLTGARREELAALRWADVDFRWNSLRIADKIEDAGRVVPLTPYVASLLRDLKRRNDTPPAVRKLRPDRDESAPAWAPSPWVFASPTAKSGRIEEPRIAHVRALQVAGITDLTLHGLRRSFGSLADGWCDVPVGVVAQVMGHKPSATAERHYRVRPLELLREWHVKIEAWMLAEAGIEFAPEQEGQKPALMLAHS